MRHLIRTAAQRCQASRQFLPGNAVYSFVRVIKPTDMLLLICLKIHSPPGRKYAAIPQWPKPQWFIIRLKIQSWRLNYSFGTGKNRFCHEMYSDGRHLTIRARIEQPKSIKAKIAEIRCIPYEALIAGYKEHASASHTPALLGSLLQRLRLFRRPFYARRRSSPDRSATDSEEV
jgi:hypothetical protein